MFEKLYVKLKFQREFNRTKTICPPFFDLGGIKSPILIKSDNLDDTIAPSDVKIT